MSWTFQRRHCNAFISWDTLLSTHSYTYSNENWHIYEVTLFHRDKINFTPAEIEKTYMLPQEQTCRNETQAQNLGHTLTNTLT